MEAILVIGPGKYKYLTVLDQTKFIEIPEGARIGRYEMTNNPLDKIDGKQIFRLTTNRKIKT